ncbi:MAG: type II secretion system protein [Opitutales bacterium]
MKKPTQRKAFTLVELLTVIAVIGILISILVPVSSAAFDMVKKAQSRNQFKNFSIALTAYKTEYGAYPTFFANEDGYNINTDTDEFIIALQGRNYEGDVPDSAANNRLLKNFYAFNESDFYEYEPASSVRKIADAFGNNGILIAVDVNGNGRLEALPDPDDPLTATVDLQSKVAVWSDPRAHAPSGSDPNDVSSLEWVFSYD